MNADYKPVRHGRAALQPPVASDHDVVYDVYGTAAPTLSAAVLVTYDVLGYALANSHVVWQSLGALTARLASMDMVGVVVAVSQRSLDLPGWLAAGLPSLDTCLAAVEGQLHDIAMVSPPHGPGRVQRVGTEGKVEV